MTMPNDAPGKMNSFANAPVQQVLDELKGFYAVMGNPPEIEGAMGIMAEKLAAQFSLKAVTAALNRCMVECRFPVRLPDIFSRIPGFDVDVNAEKRLAWETLMHFVRKYVGNDVYGNFGPEYGWHSYDFPELSPRLLDTVRRTGGWSIYARMRDEDLPFVQKRFFEEYAAWTEIQHVAADPSKVLEMPRRKGLTGIQTIPEAEKPVVNPELLTVLENATLKSMAPRTAPKPIAADPFATPYTLAARKQQAKEALAHSIERQIAAAVDPAEVDRLREKLEKIWTPDPAMVAGAKRLTEEVEKLKSNEGEIA